MTALLTTRRAVPFFVPPLNHLMALFVRLGIDLGPKMALLTVRGRKTGQPLTTPITLFELAGRRYVFGTFGETAWVRNARAAGEVTLTRGRRSETLRVLALSVDEAVPVLRDCLSLYARRRAMAPMLKRFYGVGRDVERADLTAIAREHPAFELRPR